MAKGGARPGAGRPKGSVSEATRYALEYKAILHRVISENALPIAEALVKKAKQGDTAAIKECSERLIGKVTDKVELNATIKTLVIDF